MRTRNQLNQRKHSSVGNNDCGIETENSRSFLESNNDSGTLRDVSRNTVGKLLNRANPNSRHSLRKKKQQDIYIPQCGTAGVSESREMRYVEEDSPEDSAKRVKLSPLEVSVCSRDVAGSSAMAHQQHDFPSSAQDVDDSYWEDGLTPAVGLKEVNVDNKMKGVTVEFSVLPDSTSKKPNRRASAEDKELAELVHKVHLLCLLARGRLIDSACDDPLIQASLLSLLPSDFLKISEVSKLTANVLAPVVKWFNNTFHINGPSREESSFHSALATALQTNGGTSEEVAALSVALFRALNLTTRFVSILDVVSLKPDAENIGRSGPDVSRDGRGIFNSSTLMVAASDEVGVDSKICDLTASGTSSKRSSVTNTLNNGEMVPNDKHEVSLEGQSERSMRKGDLEYQLQLEMALSATSVGSHRSDKASPTSPPELSSPTKKMKKIVSEESSTSALISTAVGSRKVGAPLYWAEVYCSGENLTGKWVHVDAVNAIIDGEQKVEAAAAACKKSLRYVVAFAGHGAKDVTRRYCTKWYKIASHRINSIWWDAVLAPLKVLEAAATSSVVQLEKHKVNTLNDIGKREALRMSHNLTDDLLPDQISLPNSDTKEAKECKKKIEAESSVGSSSVVTRDSLEDMELETRALTEPLPTSQQAYRNHPLYALERWLTRYQILHPRGPILGFVAGLPVYSRTCVQTLHTRERWLREGLQVKDCELPAKVVKRSAKLKKLQVSEADDDAGGDPEGNLTLFGKWQTEPLCLPCAVDGIVPKNERGRVDVWSEKCLPPGTVHLRMPRVAPVAKRLGIDFASAMVGFEFRNGRSYPVFEGIVVCCEFKDAILEAYAEEEDRRVMEEKERNEKQAISRWYQLLSSIVTRRRLNNCYGEILSSSNQFGDIPKADDLSHADPGGIVDASQLRVNQQGRGQDPKHGTSFQVPTEDHEHVFVTEDQTFDEKSSVRTKRCRCGFVIEVEEI
ncbi:Rad4/PNGase transglutaminase-like fold [Dillenia turbinata]|uniref:Rad4/PNGase transglutaminase-like fold n=1 Tax=Dillenia turbinata TaxID=194707 RepID=A0AAN8UKL0_9MAGN